MKPKKVSFYILVFFLVAIGFINPVAADPVYYAEQYYLMYVDGMTNNQLVIFRNIDFLLRALEAPFAPVVQSLDPKINSQEQYIRYKYLFKMHVNLLLVKSYLQLGSRYDKENIYFYNYLYKNEILHSLEFARYFYSCVFYYWEQVLIFREKAQEFQKYRINIDLWEDEYYKLKAGLIDYGSIAKDRINRIEDEIKYIQTWPDQYYPEDSGENNSSQG